MAKLQGLKLDWDPNDILFWFSQLEMHMSTAGIKRQWTKWLALQQQLPKFVIDDMKQLF